MWKSVIFRIKCDRGSGWSHCRCSVIGGRLTGYFVVGILETVDVLVICVWRWIVDIHDSGMSIPMSLSMVLGWRHILVVFFSRRAYQCRHELDYTPVW